MAPSGSECSVIVTTTTSVAVAVNGVGSLLVACTSGRVISYSSRFTWEGGGSAAAATTDGVGMVTGAPLWEVMDVIVLTVVGIMAK